MFSLLSRRRNLRLTKPALRASCLLLAFCLVAVLGLFFAPAVLHAQDDSVSAPLSGSLSDPIYTESDLTGPSSALFQGSNNLVTPYLRTGISDPLAFLIESSTLSPYALSGNLTDSYVVDSYVENQDITDSTVAARFSEYQNNRYLMSGAAAGSTLNGRAASAGALLQGNRGATMTAAGAFSATTMRAPFAAGSSLLAGRQAAGSAGTFVDPNAVVSALTSPTALNSTQGDTTGIMGDTSGAVAGGSALGPSAPSGLSDQFGTTAGVSFGMLASTPVGMLVPSADSTPMGPAPGAVFPDVTMAMSSSSGFQDSTKDTAGLPTQFEVSSTSPLASPLSESSDGPFPEKSAEATNFLNPNLFGGDASSDPYAGQQATLSLSEITRKARMHAMIYNPQGTPLPSPFEQRAMQKEFLRNRNKHHISHYPSVIVPSVTP